MSTNCKNCDKPTNGNFCSNCGQSTQTNRISLHDIIHEFLHGIVHVDKGIIYTIRELTIRPGETIRGYFEGKRVKLFKPFGYFFILATLYVFLTHMSGNNVMGMEITTVTESSTGEEIPDRLKSLIEVITSIFEKHFSILMLCSIPIISGITMFFFRAAKLNYGEHILMNSYILGHQMLLSILMLPFYFFADKYDLQIWSFWLQTVLFVYMIASTFNKYKLWKRILYPILSQFLLLFAISIITAIFIFSFMLY